MKFATIIAATMTPLLLFTSAQRLDGSHLVSGNNPSKKISLDQHPEKSLNVASSPQKHRCYRGLLVGKLDFRLASALSTGQR